MDPEAEYLTQQMDPVKGGRSERRYKTRVIRESVVVEDLDWSFENTFWVDIRSGFAWKSVQHISPELPPIEIEILKPAA